MLKRFSVENFKNFGMKTTLDLSHPNNYEFHQDAIKDGCVTKALIYGPNGSGKSNLGLAVFDIIIHLTDKERKLSRYNNYRNLDSAKALVRFEYCFQFHGIEVLYQYTKRDAETLQEEHLSIGGREVVSYDFIANQGQTALKGAETLNMTAGKSPISRVKYIRSNAILAENPENAAFYDFMEFVDHMLLFYSLDQRGYQGFTTGKEQVGAHIIENGHLERFEGFLRQEGLDYHLFAKEVDDRKALYCKFNNGEASFFSLASTGTTSLTLFYYWYMKMETASFVFIDEFDAFYHYELAEALVKLLRNLKDTQVILTTHNTDLMNNDLLRPDCYFLINGSRIGDFSSLTDKELRKAHNLQKMYKAGAFYE